MVLIQNKRGSVTLTAGIMPQVPVPTSRRGSIVIPPGAFSAPSRRGSVSMGVPSRRGSVAFDFNHQLSEPLRQVSDGSTNASRRSSAITFEEAQASKKDKRRASLTDDSEDDEDDGE